MSSKHNDRDVRGSVLKNEFTRQRWELFHQAIAHAKQASNSAVDDDNPASGSKSSGPILSIVR